MPTKSPKDRKEEIQWEIESLEKIVAVRRRELKALTGGGKTDYPAWFGPLPEIVSQRFAGLAYRIVSNAVKEVLKERDQLTTRRELFGIVYSQGCRLTLNPRFAWRNFCGSINVCISGGVRGPGRGKLVGKMEAWKPTLMEVKDDADESLSLIGLIEWKDRDWKPSPSDRALGLVT